MASRMWSPIIFFFPVSECRTSLQLSLQWPIAKSGYMNPVLSAHNTHPYHFLSLIASRSMHIRRTSSGSFSPSFLHHLSHQYRSAPYFLAPALSLIMPEGHKSRITSDISRIDGLDEDNSTIPKLRRLTFLLLLGTPSLERLLQIIEQEDDTQWKELKTLLVDRTSNINVVASLAIGTCASFLASSGPTDIANWSHPFPYLCILAGSVFATLSVLSGIGLLAFVNTLRPQTVKDMRSSNLKFVLTITLLAMPFLCLFISGLASVTGCLGAVWFGNSTWARTGVTAGFAWFIIMILVIFGSLY